MENTQVLNDDALTKFFNEGTAQVDNPIIETPPVTEPIVDPVVETPIPSVNTNSRDYSDIVKSMIEDGDWQDAEVELEDGSKVMLSEMKDVDAEIFRELKKQQKELSKEEFDSKYISVDGLDETTRKMIDLKKAGGDISELIQVQSQIVDPLANLDLDNENVQANLVRQKLQYLGWEPKYIEAKIEDLRKEFKLDTEAQNIVNEIKTNFSKQLDEQKAAAEKQRQEQQESQKQFRKTISETYKTLDLKNESLTKTLVDNASKADEYGLTATDKLYFEAKTNPELFAKLNLLLTNEEKFNEFMGVKIKNQATVNAVNKVLSLKPKSSSSAAVEQQGKKDTMENFFNQS